MTHFWPGNDRAAARKEFGGEVLAAEEGLTVTLGVGYPSDRTAALP
ncbi:hypothetical protein ACFOY2_01940 [Nonomuraea purpurea]|uniref:Uncharacterized protein n=1 Tax=Nonomuraea purpurea TaxID=1849276 RepID=A0ABV8G0B3_9ACTN